MSRMCATRDAGFTLIELMIVVVIIGVLALLAIPRYTSATVRAKQSEARQFLKQIYVLQSAFHEEHRFYGDGGTAGGAGTVFPQIGAEIMVGARYFYVMVSAPQTFTCTATANLDGDATTDVWIVNESGVITNTINDVTA